MKLILITCSFIAVLLLSGCQSGPEALAEKYMALVCKHDALHKDLEAAKSDKEQARLTAKIESVVEQLEKLNIRILDKYQDNEEAMDVILKVTEDYQCKED